MTEQEMRDLILSRVPTHLVTHHQLWRLCNGPQRNDSALFDTTLLSLVRDGEIVPGIVPPGPESLVRQPLKGYAAKGG